MKSIKNTILTGALVLGMAFSGNVYGQTIKTNSKGFQKFNKKEQLIKEVKIFGDRIEVTKNKYDSKNNLRKTKNYTDFSLNGHVDTKSVTKYGYGEDGEHCKESYACYVSRNWCEPKMDLSL